MMKKYQTIYVLPFLVASFTLVTFAANRQLGGRLAPIVRMPYQFATFQRRLLSQSAGHSFKSPTRFAYRRKQLTDRLWCDRHQWDARLFLGTCLAIPAGGWIALWSANEQDQNWCTKRSIAVPERFSGNEPYSWFWLRVACPSALNAELMRVIKDGDSQSAEKVQALLQHGANPGYSEDTHWCTTFVLNCAMREKNSEVALLLIAAGAPLENGCVRWALDAHLPEVVTALIKAGVPLGSGALVSLAIEQRLPDSAMELIRAGAPVDQIGFMGTPLERAAERGYTDVAYALITAGARVELSGRDHEVLFAAARRGDMKLARALLIASDPRSKHADAALNRWKHHHLETAEEFKLLLNRAGYCIDPPAPAPVTASVEPNKSGHLGSACLDWGLFSWLVPCLCEQDRSSEPNCVGNYVSRSVGPTG